MVLRRWQPDGEIFAQSSILTGQGTYQLSSLSATGLDAPTDGVIVWRFDLYVSVATFDTDEVWNAISGNTTQLRGGRFIIRSRNGGQGEEYFVNRPQQVVRNLWFFDADAAESSTSQVGSGNIRVTLSNESLNAKFCDRVLYGFEPSVGCTVTVEGTYMIMDNPGNLHRFLLIR